MSKLVVYAIGGNALSDPKGGSFEETALVLAKVLSDVVDLLEAGWSVVLTHGNGPQVGELLQLDSENNQSMDSWVAATQGMIGHELSLNLDSILDRRGRPERTAVILTRVEVSPEDDAFLRPTKPVGPILSDQRVFDNDWDIAETINGPRRVVASPKPIHVLDLDVIDSLVKLGAVVICGGGGGIPVIRKDEHWLGVPAVIDKDHLSGMLATELDANALIISTGVDAVKLNFGGDNEEILRKMELKDAEKHLQNGEFPVGSMGPKVAALIDAVQIKPNLQAIICQPGDALASIRGSSGTTLFNERAIRGSNPRPTD